MTPGTPITTPDELDALPAGSVVRDWEGDAWLNLRGGWTTAAPGFYGSVTPADYLPVTVLHVPGEPHLTQDDAPAERTTGPIRATSAGHVDGVQLARALFYALNPHTTTAGSWDAIRPELRARHIGVADGIIRLLTEEAP